MPHTHEHHAHTHGPDCGHTAITHGAHTDYAHDGHLHHIHDGGVEECEIAVDAANPAECTPAHDCECHPKAHLHGAECGHDALPHGDHVDFLVGGHLHQPHGEHCDDHGPISVE